MDLRQRINLNLAVLGVLGALLVGLGQFALGSLLVGQGLANVLLPGGVLLAAVASWWYCDVRERFALDRWVINAVVVIMAAVAALRFSQVGGPVDAAIAADALMGLMIVLFFERKSLRTWWDLFSLSLLLVFLSCAFYHGPLFAVVLTVYLFFALSLLALMSLHRQQEHCRDGVVADTKRRRPPGVGQTDWWRLSGVACATLLVGPLSLYLRFRPLPDSRGRGPQAGGRSALPDDAQANGLPVPTVELPADGRRGRTAPGPEFGWRMGRLTLASLAIGGLVFGVMPRFGGVDFSSLRGRGPGWQTASASLQRSVGFDDQVQLGEMGSIIENTQRALTIRFVQLRSGERYPVQGSLFLRGAALTDYVDGRWEYRPDGAAEVMRRLPMERQDAPAAVVRQEIRLDPMDRPELFAVWPFLYAGEDDRVQFDPERARLHRPGTLRRRTFSYELLTTAFVEGRQADIVPAGREVDARQLLQWPAASLPRLAALATEWLDEAQVPATDTIGRARALERALRSSPRFSYRLGDYDRTPDLDPIEDFIVNDPRGHCEHFATALTLMLRSQELPARMIVGYKTDEYNYLEERYWARQSHAHTWVEVYLTAEAIPDEFKRRDGLSDWSRGGWLRLDATPSNLDELSLVEYLKHTYRYWQAGIRTAWTQHVLQMSGSRQDLLIYRPLIQGVRNSLSNLSDRQWWLGGESLGVNEALASPWRLIRSPLLLTGGAVLMGGMLVGLIAARRRSALRSRLSGFPGGRHRRSGQQAPATAEFYRRWESLLHRWGLERGPAETPREFAREAGRQLAEAAEQPQLHDAALRVIEAFYEVRFGRVELDARTSALVEDALASIQRATKENAGKRNGAPRR